MRVQSLGPTAGLIVFGIRGCNKRGSIFPISISTEEAGVSVADRLNLNDMLELLKDSVSS